MLVFTMSSNYINYICTMIINTLSTVAPYTYIDKDQNAYIRYPLENKIKKAGCTFEKKRFCHLGAHNKNLNTIIIKMLLTELI